MTTAVRTPPNHDTTTCYTTYRCRRPECVDRYNTINRARLRAHKAGTYSAYVDAEPTRQHILRLRRAGMSSASIAHEAGLTTQCILEFVQTVPSHGRGRRQRTTPATEAKILAVTIESRTTGRIDATGARRRIQALAALGWPVSHTARHAGLFDVGSYALLQRDQIFVSTAKAIAATYDKLRTLKPEKHGVTKQHAHFAKNRAARLHWQPPKYWDDPDHPIDDPDFEPWTAAQAIAEEARWLMDIGGLDIEQASKRLRRSYKYVCTCLREYPPADKQVAA